MYAFMQDEMQSAGPAAASPGMQLLVTIAAVSIAITAVVNFIRQWRADMRADAEAKARAADAMKAQQAAEQVAKDAKAAAEAAREVKHALAASTTEVRVQLTGLKEGVDSSHKILNQQRTDMMAKIEHLEKILAARDVADARLEREQDKNVKGD
jgi:hypothetical protein